MIKLTGFVYFQKTSNKFKATAKAREALVSEAYGENYADAIANLHLKLIEELNYAHADLNLSVEIDFR